MSRTNKSKANKPSGYKLTDKHFDVFVQEGKYWQKYFGLLDWEIVYTLAYSRDLRGWCSVNELKDRVAEIGLSARWELPPTNKRIRRTVFHEIVELLTMRFFILAVNRSSTYQDIMEENHRVVRSLENSLFEESYSRRFKTKE